MPSPLTLQAMAVQAARRGGMHALKNKERRTEVHQALEHDVKLQLDIECQSIIEQVISSAYPSHRILGEEETGNAVGGNDELEWIIDPIDGTVNFSHGLQNWCCSVAVRKNDLVIAGAVFAPELNLLYETSIDQPALCNGSEIKVSQTGEIKKALVFTGADKDEKSGVEPFRFFHSIAEQVQRPRISGSAALDICQVAAGHAEGYFEPKIYIWDIAAAGLILEQAGGKIEPMWHRAGHSMACLATNGKIHAPLLDTLKMLLP